MRSVYGLLIEDPTQGQLYIIRGVSDLSDPDEQGIEDGDEQGIEDGDD